jgi:hypothetical protein
MNTIIKTFEQAGISLQFDDRTSTWVYENRVADVYVYLTSKNDARGLPFVYGEAYVGDVEYGLAHPVHLWLEMFDQAAALLAKGNPPF